MWEQICNISINVFQTVLEGTLRVYGDAKKCTHPTLPTPTPTGHWYSQIPFNSEHYYLFSYLASPLRFNLKREFECYQCLKHCYCRIRCNKPILTRWNLTEINGKSAPPFTPAPNSDKFKAQETWLSRHSKIKELKSFSQKCVCYGSKVWCGL
jgi:hypothetical protein